MRKHAVIVAGGSGSRLGGALPKQFRLLGGKPLLWWSLKAFHDDDPACVIHLVLPEQFMDMWRAMYAELPEADRIEHTTHPGGSTRTASVLSALSTISAGEDVFVAVHDAARPLVSRQTVREGWNKAFSHGAAVPVTPVVDSLRMLEGEGSKAVDRSRFVAVQTPQVFGSVILKDAYRKGEGGVFTDDASVVEAAGVAPVLFEGNPENIKVTNPGDIEIAEVLLARRRDD
ncbi:MAG: 2-C-methyl-D-erythritol 4-phosphate cytidylyltransferase [Muribaculaceae bacterium]|nr:2-C-methyl-D-erythritol 4-phosphate cytidylyltransferase [Muribaculaceae bacterium]